MITAVMRRLEDSWCPMPNRKRVRHAPLRALVALSRRAHPRISPTRGPPGRHGARQNWLRARASRTSTRCELGLESRRAECRDEPGMQLDDIEPADETPCEQPAPFSPSKGARSHPHLFAKPCVRGFARQPRVPRHGIRKPLDLAGRLECFNLTSECNSGACCHGADGYGGIKSPCSSRSPDGSGPSPTPGPNPERPGWSGIVMCDSATLFS